MVRVWVRVRVHVLPAASTWVCVAGMEVQLSTLSIISMKRHSSVPFCMAFAQISKACTRLPLSWGAMKDTGMDAGPGTPRYGMATLFGGPARVCTTLLSSLRSENRYPWALLHVMVRTLNL
jgi:hypothetical protein